MMLQYIKNLLISNILLYKIELDLEYGLNDTLHGADLGLALFYYDENKKMSETSNLAKQIRITY